MLSKARKFRFPFVFDPVKQLMLKIDVNVEDVIQCGINGLNLGYFPALRIHDQSRKGVYIFNFQGEAGGFLMKQGIFIGGPPLQKLV